MTTIHAGSGPSVRPPRSFIQICASQNDLFALDQTGDIYWYDFKAKAWLKLGPRHSYEERA